MDSCKLIMLHWLTRINPRRGRSRSMITARVEEFQPVRDVLTQQAGRINRVGQRQQADDRALQEVNLQWAVSSISARVF
jgi:hypothetical protein